MKNLYATIYANVKKAHPDWSSKKCYTVVGKMMAARREKAAANA